MSRPWTLWPRLEAVPSAPGCDRCLLATGEAEIVQRIMEPSGG